MKAFPRATTGDKIRKHLTADWINTINAFLNQEDAPSPEELNGGAATPRFALVRVDSSLTGAEVYRGVFAPMLNRSVDGSANTQEANWFDANLGDCAIVNWGGDGGHSLAVGTIIPGFRYGTINIDGTRLLPAYHVGGVGGGNLPTGEFQYMLWQMTSDNQSGWDFARAHPIL